MSEHTEDIEHFRKIILDDQKETPPQTFSKKKIKTVKQEKAKVKSVTGERISTSLMNEKISEKDIRFVFETIMKEAEYDKISVKQLCYGMLSAVTKTGISHRINSKDSGAGKSYLLNLLANYFPEKHVIILAGASDKAFHHRDGIMVIKDSKTGELKPTEPILAMLKQELYNLKKETDTSSTSEIKKIKDGDKREFQIESEIKHILKHEQKLIDLNDMIIIIQDTPQDSLFHALMSLISQDSEKDQEYTFAEKSSSGKLGSKTNILRGMPVIFTTRVIDDSDNARFEEINRRFVNVTPNVSSEKINAANRLIGSKFGYLPEEYDILIVSRSDKEKAKKIIQIIVEKLRNHSTFLRPKESGVKIPFHAAITNALPGDDVWDMTVTDRTMRYLSVITKINMDNRPKLVNTETRAFYPISTFEDLKETLELMKLGASNIRPYIKEWYDKVLIRAYKSLNGELKQRISSCGMIIEKESRVGLTTEELAQKTHELMEIPIPGIRELREKFLYPLSNQGLANYVKSQLNKNENLWYPVDPSEKKSFADSEDPKLRVKDPAVYPSINVLQKGFRSIVNEEGKTGEGIPEQSFRFYRLEDSDGSKLTVNEMLQKYFTNPEICFLKEKDPSAVLNNIFYAQQVLAHLQNQK